MIFREIVLELTSPFITPWQADTLFGHIAWSIRDEQGDAALQDFLRRYEEGEPPVVLSDGFAAGWLPRPLVPSNRVVKTEEDARRAKKNKKARWMTLEQYERQSWDDLPDEGWHTGDAAEIVTLHNTISRITGTSLEDGGLYPVAEKVLRHPSQRLSIFVRFASEADEPAFLHHLGQVAKTGYGSRKTVGKGQFRIAEVRDRTAWLKERMDGCNAEMWLSGGVPAASDPTEGWFRGETKYGKLGSGWNHANPYKRPLTRIMPGAVFKVSHYRGYAGRMVRNISAVSEVVQYAYALTLPLRLESDRFEALSDGYAGGL